MDLTHDEKRALRGGFRAADGLAESGLKPIAAAIPRACHISGLSRSEIYRRLATGDIQAVKSGARTLILMDSLRAHLANLPAATFRGPGVVSKETAPGAAAPERRIDVSSVGTNDDSRLVGPFKRGAGK